MILCRLVGETGHVYAFDIQAQAIQATRHRLERVGLLERATLLERGHELMLEHIPTDVRPSAVMFNLGYLPGSSKSVITRPITTLAAIDAAASLIAPQGIISIVVYPGHAGGAEEAAAVEAHVAKLSSARYAVRLWKPLNAPGNSPYVIGIRRHE